MRTWIVVCPGNGFHLNGTLTWSFFLPLWSLFRSALAQGRCTDPSLPPCSPGQMADLQRWEISLLGMDLHHEWFFKVTRRDEGFIYIYIYMISWCKIIQVLIHRCMLQQSAVEFYLSSSFNDGCSSKAALHWSDCRSRSVIDQTLKKTLISFTNAVLKFRGSVLVVHHHFLRSSH